MGAIKNHPKSLWVLCFANLCDGFSYYGTMTVLALYAMHVFHLSRDTSYTIYGLYAALIYSTPALGGIIADRWLGSRKTLFMGGILAILGNLILLSKFQYGFSLGLATSVVGSGFYKSNSTHLIGSLYGENDPRKEIGFTWLYVFCNFGGALSPLVYGYLIYKSNWNDGFLCSAIVIFISLLWFIFSRTIRDDFTKVGLGNISKTLTVCLSVIAGCLLLSLPFYKPELITPIMLIFFIGIITLLTILMRKYQGIERKRLGALIIMGLFGMLYYTTVMQIGTTITLFIQNEIDKGYINTHFPASVFSTFYALFVILLAPIYASVWNAFKRKGIEFSAPVKLAIGIMFAALAIVCFVISSVTSFIVSGIILGNLLLSAGDLIFTPPILTCLSNNAPSGIKNSIMGSWFLTVALGGYLSSVFANFSHVVAARFMPHTQAFTSEFIFIVLFTVLVSLGLLLLSPKLNKILI